MVTITNFTCSTCASGMHYLPGYNAKCNMYNVRSFMFLVAVTIALTFKIEAMFIII